MFIIPVSRSFDHANFRPARRLVDAPVAARLLDDTFERFFSAPVREEPARSPALDVAESEHAYTVTLEIPGVAKEDVQVSVEGRRVTVKAGDKPTAETASPPQAQTTDAAPADHPTAQADAPAPATSPAAAPVAGDRLIHRERVAARYARSFTLPLEIEQGEAGAKLENGVLTLTLPKRNARAAARLTIN